MAKKEILKKHGIVRNAVRKDVLFFVIPWIIVMLAGMGICAWDLVRRQESLYEFSTQNMVGLMLIVIGFVIILIAQITLWKYYSSTLVIKENHQLITHGIYRFVRHPIYLGNITLFLGIAVYVSSLYGFLTLLGLIPVFLVRIRMEERLLTEEFGDKHRTYKKNTRKLFPFIF